MTVYSLAAAWLAGAPMVVATRSITDWMLSSSLEKTAASRNARLADTFYGVAPAYALPDRPAYAAKAGLIAWRLGVNAARELTPDLRLFLVARVDSVADAANRASPLVRQTHGGSVGVGLSYTFARSSQRASD